MNCSIFGYMSSGEIVPDVMTTVLNRSNTGLIAMAGSRHLIDKTRLEAGWKVTEEHIRKMEDRIRNGGIVSFERF